MKVIIADDEQKVAQLINDLIDWKSLGMEVVATAKNGNEALDYIGIYAPDIVITDIRMPGLGGIELIAKAKEIAPSLRFIIISGYKHFEYAHQAIKFGVSDYLLKPIKQAELRETLERIRSEYEKLNSQLSEQERMQRIEEDEIKRNRQALFSLLMDPSNRPALRKEYLNSEFGYQFDDGIYQVVILKLDGDYDEIYSDGLPIFTKRIDSIFKNALHPLCFDFELDFIYSAATTVINYAAENKEVVKSALKDIFYDVRQQNNLFPSAIITMAVGSAEQEPSGLVDSWQYADRILWERLINGGGSLVDSIASNLDASNLSSLIADTSRAMENAMEVFDIAALDLAISSSSAKLLEKENLTGKDVFYFAESVVNVYFLLAQRLEFTYPAGEKLRNEFLTRIEVLNTGKAVIKSLKEMVIASFGEMLENRGEINARPVRNAKQYIKEHFSEQISLDEIAAKEGFNTSYFSTLFKKETGCTFSEYIHDARMEEAKRLLRETNHSIASICENVGYCDIKHFSGSFKKTTGVKPSEFRKLYSWVKG